MVERVVELGAEGESRVLAKPIQCHFLRSRQIEVRLSRTSSNSCSAVPEARADSVRADDGRSCET